MVKQRTRIYPLSQAANPPALNFVNGRAAVQHGGPADFRFWELLNSVVQEEPLAVTRPTTPGLLRRHRHQKGKPFQPDGG